MKQVTALVPTKITAKKIMVNIDPIDYFRNNQSRSNDEIKHFIRIQLSEYCEDVEVSILAYTLACDDNFYIYVQDGNGKVYKSPDLACYLVEKIDYWHPSADGDLFDDTLEQVYGHLLGG